MGRLVLLVLVMALAGCGGTSDSTDNPGGSTPHVPSAHVVYPDLAAPRLAAGAGTAIGPFTLPAAQLSYTVTERTTTLTQDTWTTGVASAAEVAIANAGQPYRAYALKSHTTGGVSGSDTVPADTYYLVVVCENIIDACVFSYQVSATY